MTQAFFGEAGPTVAPPATGPVPVPAGAQNPPLSSPPVTVAPSAPARFEGGGAGARFDDASVRRSFSRHHTAAG